MKEFFVDKILINSKTDENVESLADSGVPETYPLGLNSFICNLQNNRLAHLLWVLPPSRISLIRHYTLMLHSQYWENEIRQHILLIEGFIVVLGFALSWLRCNIVIRPHFSVHMVGILEGNTLFCMPLGCVVHYPACTAQPRGHTGMGQVLTFARVGGGISRE